jgi:hypothetical protein
MIVIVGKKLRGFVEAQFWWGCHQSARAKKFWHHPTLRGISIPTYLQLKCNQRLYSI